MLFPGLVNGNEHNGLFKRFDQLLSFCFIGLFKIGGNLENPMSIGYRHHDVLIDFGLGFKNIFHYRIGLTGHMLNFPEVALPKDRKSTRLNSSHVRISYAVFCLKKKILTNTSNTSTISY